MDRLKQYEDLWTVNKNSYHIRMSGEDYYIIDENNMMLLIEEDDNIYLSLIRMMIEHDVRVIEYDLETKIINDLYNYRDPITGQRVVSIALRNKDAIILGLTGERCGDVIYFMEEGHNIIHADSLSTQKGYFNTSVSPIFVAAGKGIKAGYTTERVIRQVDVAPTVAAPLGLRMPAQCEGAPAYQIFED